MASGTTADTRYRPAIICGVPGGLIHFIVEPDQNALRSIAELVDNGRLRPVLDRVLSLTETRSGLEALETS
jgi:NADPH:quinone reductase-like Zn-dependent oxidoreductase